MTQQPAITIDLPRLPDETAPAYAARVAYVTMGAQRSLSAVGRSLGKSTTLMSRWSAAHDWARSARQYDDALAAAQAQQAAADYLAQLKRLQADSLAYGRALCGVAVEMLTELRDQKKAIEYSPAALSTIARAMTTGIDLQALALRVADVLPKLTYDEPGTE